jgi:hypothetical protein
MTRSRVRLIVISLAAAAAAALLGFLLALGARDAYFLIGDRSAGPDTGNDRAIVGAVGFKK